MHDPRVGRFFTVDPLSSKYPWYSSYQFSGNRPIDKVELEGLEPADAPYKNKEGSVSTAPDHYRIKTNDYALWDIIEVFNTDWYWHNGGVQGSERGWYKKDEYEKLIAPVAIEYAQQNGNDFAVSWQGARAMLNRGDSAPVEPSGGVSSFTSSRNMKEGALDTMLELGNKIIDGYNSSLVYMASGHASPMDVDSPFFVVGGLNKLFSFAKNVQKNKTFQFAFWSDKGTEAAAVSSGFKVLRETRAANNLQKLIDTHKLSDEVAREMWGRMSATLANSVPKNGIVHVFVTKRSKDYAKSIWNSIEKPILESKGVKIIEHIIDK